MSAQKSKASLSFAVFGISFALAAADQVKHDVKPRSQSWNRAASLEAAANRLLDSVAPAGPAHQDSSNAGAIFDLVTAESARAGVRCLNEYCTAFSLMLVDEVKRKAPIRSHQWNRAEAMEQAIKKLLDTLAVRGRTADLDAASRVFDVVEAKIMALYAPPKPARQRGKDGRFVRTEVDHV